MQNDVRPMVGQPDPTPCDPQNLLLCLVLQGRSKHPQKVSEIRSDGADGYFRSQTLTLQERQADGPNCGRTEGLIAVAVSSVLATAVRF
jgi:hypothetical protein